MDNRTLEEVRKNETKLIEEIKSLEKQLKYLRSGEYYNQLRFENEMLQQVVDTNGVPSEVYDYIDCTHRNTELLEENQELKKQLETYEIEGYEQNEELNKMSFDIRKYKIQQKEFIKWLEDYLKLFDNMNIEEQVSYDMIEEILSKFKEIIGGDNQ